MFADPCGAHSFVRADEQANGIVRVAQLPNGNNAPHDMDREQLRAFLDEAQDDLAKHDEKMEMLLKDVVAKIQRRIWDARNLLHPLRTLSDDVLHEIFTHCFLDREALEWKFCTEPDSDYSALNSKNVPWTLSQVCSSWRRVALSAPRLWSTIIFTFPSLPAKRKTGSRKLSRFCYNLGLFMSRSGNADIRWRVPYRAVGLCRT
ncbi:hypothetical protein CPB85DRAFT_245019 [Mucidula mucida]|nr:hypothetical protein CPB85DRAFT_245019 [Mucidula mucida]